VGGQAHAVRATGLPGLEFMPNGNAANLYVYPAEADYLDARPLDDSWTRMDSRVRETDEDYVVPAEVADRPGDSALSMGPQADRLFTGGQHGSTGCERRPSR
jgi:hypothetical protein